MSKALRRFCGMDVPRWIYVAGFVLLAAVRLAIAASQRVYLMPQDSGLDDMLMIRAGISIAEGGWLGEYSGIAIAKNMGFALWLAAVHALGAPVLWANGALWVLACGFAVWALRPLAKGRLVRICLFALLAYHPFSFAFFVQRVYRDGIFSALCLLFFAGVAGLVLRLGKARAGGSVLCAITAGLGLAGAWLCREDGALLLVFGVCALGLYAVWVLARPGTTQRAARLACAVLPFVLLLGGRWGFSALNQAHYGVFMVNDMSEGEFAKAYGRMAAISEAESGFARQVPVSRQALELMMQASPALAQLEPQLQAGGPVYNGFASQQSGEYGGSFYFALKLAAGNAGLTPDGEAAQQLWARISRELDAAVQSGQLASARPAYTTVPRWDSSLLAPTLGEAARSIWAVVSFADCDPRPAFSIGDGQDINETAAWLHSETQQGYAEGSDKPYYNALQRACFALCDALVWVYRVAIWPLLALGLWGMARALRRGIATLLRSRRCGGALLFGLLALGLLASVAARIIVAAYMETAAFGIGTYAMYLAPALPPLLLFCALGALLAGGDALGGNEK